MVLAVSVLVFVVLVHAAAARLDPAEVARRLIVYPNPVLRGRINHAAAATTARLTSVKRLKSGSSFSVYQVAPSASVSGTAESLRTAGFIVEPDSRIHAADIIDYVPNDPLYKANAWGLERIKASGAWARTSGNGKLVVAIIDSGCDYRHPDLAPNIWVNPHEIPGNGVDDDGNGYIDDVYGYDFVNSDGDPMDDNYVSHGTAVAGVIGMVANNSRAGVGAAPMVKMMCLKVLDDMGEGTTSDALLALEYADAIGVKVSCNSWGGDGFSSAFSSKLTELQQRHLFIAAAGNLGLNLDLCSVLGLIVTGCFFPASYSQTNVISVGASTNTPDLPWTRSNFGLKSVDVFAPGVGITTTGRSNTNVTLSGTSFAAPYVAAAVALVWMYNPTLSVASVKSLVLSKVDKPAAYLLMSASKGRLNLKQTVLAIPAPVAPATATTTTTATAATMFQSTAVRAFSPFSSAAASSSSMFRSSSPVALRVAPPNSSPAPFAAFAFAAPDGADIECRLSPVPTLDDDFEAEGGYNELLWSSIRGGRISTRCGSASGQQALTFDEPVDMGERYAATRFVDATNYASVRFNLALGWQDASGGSDRCDKVGPAQGVVFQYGVLKTQGGRVLIADAGSSRASLSMSFPYPSDFGPVQAIDTSSSSSSSSSSYSFSASDAPASALPFLGPAADIDVTAVDIDWVTVLDIKSQDANNKPGFVMYEAALPNAARNQAVSFRWVQPFHHTQDHWALDGVKVPYELLDNVALPSTYSSWHACTSPTQYNNLTDGRHVFAARVKQVSSEVASVPATHTWSVDTLPPSCTIADPRSPITGDPAVSIPIAFSEPVSGMSVADIAVSATPLPSADTTYLAQEFASADQARASLAGSSLTFHPYRGGYRGCVTQQRTVSPPSPQHARALALNDDSSLYVGFEAGAAVRFYNKRYEGVYVGSNGYITFGSPDSTSFVSVDSHFSLPRVSALLSDINPELGGSVTVEQDERRLAITYTNMLEYRHAVGSTFQVELFFDGRIRITWAQVEASNALVGISPGFNNPHWSETNIASLPLCTVMGSVPCAATSVRGSGREFVARVALCAGPGQYRIYVKGGRVRDAAGNTAALSNVVTYEHKRPAVAAAIAAQASFKLDATDSTTGPDCEALPAGSKCEYFGDTPGFCDCQRRCVPAVSFLSRLGSALCDADLDCEELAHDCGDCGVGGASASRELCQKQGQPDMVAPFVDIYGNDLINGPLGHTTTREQVELTLFASEALANYTSAAFVVSTGATISAPPELISSSAYRVRLDFDSAFYGHVDVTLPVDSISDAAGNTNDSPAGIRLWRTRIVPVKPIDCYATQ